VIDKQFFDYYNTKEGKMERDTNNVRSNGIGFGGMLAILFIGLKLTGFIQWSWVWVLSPIWIPFAIVVVIVLIAVIIKLSS